MSNQKSRTDKGLATRKSPAKSKRKKRRRRFYNSPLMVAGGDSEGKVAYTYPTGNCEDY